MKRKLRDCLLPVILGCSLLLTTSCSKETLKAFSDLAALRSDLIKEYKEQNVNVVLSNFRMLKISFINSAFNNLGEREKATKAQEIAVFAANHYASAGTIDQIWVAFTIYKEFFIFHYTNSLATYFFDRNKLTASASSNTAAPKGSVIASYNPELDQTDVYLARNFQLNGNSQRGIMLFVHLTVAGNKMMAPKSVLFDFSTYSERKLFSQDPQFLIYADNQMVYSGRATLKNTLGDDSEKSVNQFISHEISYSQFLQLVGGKAVKLVLGRNEFTLTEEQLRTLSEMKRCVDESGCA